jgi:glycine dehydrogenase
LALTLLAPPGEWDADIAPGRQPSFGMPMGEWSYAVHPPAATSLASRLPGRLVGVSVDVTRQPTYRLALQTREQTQSRKGQSNICTAQVLPAVIASVRGGYHGPRAPSASPARTPHRPSRPARKWATTSSTRAPDSVTVKTATL